MESNIINEWIELYKSKSSHDIGKIYGVSLNTVLKYLRISGIKIRSKSPINLPHKKKFNTGFFNKIDNEDKSYFLGLLFADGNMSKTNVISISLQKSDKHIIDYFLKCLEGNMRIYEYRNECILKFTDKEITKDLTKLGFISKKSLVIKFPTIPTHLESHFMRGVFDGDGCISIHHDKRDSSDRGQVNICSGSIDFLNVYVDKLSEHCDIKHKNIRCPNGIYNVIDWGGLSDVEKIYNFLYKDAKVYLKRKKKKFDEVMIINSSKIKYRKHES